MSDVGFIRINLCMRVCNRYEDIIFYRKAFKINIILSMMLILAKQPINLLSNTMLTFNIFTP